MLCKTWKLMAEKYFNPLCANRFFPDFGNQSCPICVKPVQVSDDPPDVPEPDPEAP